MSEFDMDAITRSAERTTSKYYDLESAVNNSWGDKRRRAILDSYGELCDITRELINLLESSNRKLTAIDEAQKRVYDRHLSEE